VITPEKSFIVHASSPAQKDAWVQVNDQLSFTGSVYTHAQFTGSVPSGSVAHSSSSIAKAYTSTVLTSSGCMSISSGAFKELLDSKISC
jgi:hypothetical protein